MITLVGYMGSGKSTIGKALARHLNYEFIDLDQLIEEKMGCSITELFAEHGEEGFRTIEINLLQYAIMKGEQQAVLSTGGGTPMRQGIMKYINNVSTSFFLHVPAKNLAIRLAATKSERPIIAKKTESELPTFIADHLTSRLPFYKKAHHTVNNKSQEQTISEILALYTTE